MKSHTLALSLFQAEPVLRKQDCINLCLSRTDPGCYVYYGDLVQALVESFGGTVRSWRANVSRYFPEGKLDSTVDVLESWVKLRTVNGLIIFTRREDYETITQKRTTPVGLRLVRGSKAAVAA